jgi:hypothetical protein
MSQLSIFNRIDTAKLIMEFDQSIRRSSGIGKDFEVEYTPLSSKIFFMSPGTESYDQVK